MHKYMFYSLSGSLLVLSAYLKSPVVCIGVVVLAAIAVAENILTKSAKDAEIIELRSEMAKLQKEHKTLTMEIANVAERAKTVLGEVY